MICPYLMKNISSRFYLGQNPERWHHRDTAGTFSGLLHTKAESL